MMFPAIGSAPEPQVSVVHSEYRSDSVSGENLAVDAMTQALINAGFDVQRCTRRTDDMQITPGYERDSAIRVGLHRDSAQAQPRVPVPRSARDILMVHNLFPNFGARWLLDWPGPVVAVLHNFRYLCANGLLLRHGVTCTACIEHRSQVPGLVHRCYRNSLVATLPLVVGDAFASRRHPLLRRADALVAQTETAFDVYRTAGVREDALRVIPGFTVPPVFPDRQIDRRRWLVAGRLSPEKGVVELLESWPPGEPLDVVGTGPLAAELAERFSGVANFVGTLDHVDLLGRLPGYRGLVFPGRCLEGAYPMVVREALAAGTPVVARDGSSAASLLRTQGGGVVYAGDAPAEIRDALAEVTASAATLQAQAKDVFSRLFTRERWVASMTSLFAELAFPSQAHE